MQQPEAAAVQETPATLRLKPGEEDRLLAGHQWLFSNEVDKIEGEVQPGSLAVAVTSRGQPVGIGVYNPHSLIAWRLWSRTVEAIDVEFFRRRLQAALRLRERLYPGERSFRLCFGESDGLPGLVVDKYEDVLVLQVLSAGMEKRIDLIAEALDLLVAPKGIFLSNDHSARALEGLKSERRVLKGDVPGKVTIQEAGVKFVTPMTEGQKTGFYFDQRENRACAARFAKDRNVLDLHCYTGGFSLALAKAGAAKVLGLDSSELAIGLAREGAALNGLEGVCEFDQGEAEEVLRAFSTQRQPFEPDFILVDPPSFVPSRKHLAKALRAYVKLNALAMKCLSSGGFLASSTCSHHVGREDFMQMLRESAAKAGRRFRVLEERTQAGDHPILLAMPETQYLHFALLEAL
ncbi:MAG: class I SAM-dependent rRNA methyltransferase [Elusimicrobia bacterium]|nr:class I SAM-dependent rRNA methyltransferase [Elusimicrobiota bacterium]